MRCTKCSAKKIADTPSSAIQTTRDQLIPAVIANLRAATRDGFRSETSSADELEATVIVDRYVETRDETERVKLVSGNIR